MLLRFLEAVRTQPWDGICEAYGKIAFDRMPSAPRGYVSEVKDICQSVRGEYKKGSAESANSSAFRPMSISKTLRLLRPL